MEKAVEALNTQTDCFLRSHQAKMAEIYDRRGINRTQIEGLIEYQPIVVQEQRRLLRSSTPHHNSRGAGKPRYQPAQQPNKAHSLARFTAATHSHQEPCSLSHDPSVACRTCEDAKRYVDSNNIARTEQMKSFLQSYNRLGSQDRKRYQTFMR